MANMARWANHIKWNREIISLTLHMLLFGVICKITPTHKNKDANRCMNGIFRFLMFFWTTFIYNLFYLELPNSRYDFPKFYIENGQIVISLNSYTIQNRKESSYSKYLNNFKHIWCFEVFNLKSFSKVIYRFTSKAQNSKSRGLCIIYRVNTGA